MAKLLQVRQVSRTFVRGMGEYVLTVEQRRHKNVEGPLKMWRNISLFVGAPALALAMLNVYLRSKEHGEHERKEFVHYPYLKIMRKPFPWGDGKHSFFHNPKTNYVPGIGYEE